MTYQCPPIPPTYVIGVPGGEETPPCFKQTVQSKKILGKILCELFDLPIININIMLVNALDRLGRNAFEVLATVKVLIDNGINLYMQKEQLTLLDDQGKPTMFAPIMIATLSTCAQLERDSIAFRLNSGKKLALEQGRCVLGRKKGSVKTKEQKEKEYKEVLMYLNKGYSIRVTSKLTKVSVATLQRLKNEFIRDA